MPVAAVIDEKVSKRHIFSRQHLTILLQIFCMHGGLSPDLNSLEQIKRIMRPTDVRDSTLPSVIFCNIWSGTRHRLAL